MDFVQLRKPKHPIGSSKATRTVEVTAVLWQMSCMECVRSKKLGGSFFFALLGCLVRGLAWWGWTFDGVFFGGRSLLLLEYLEFCTQKSRLF